MLRERCEEHEAGGPGGTEFPLKSSWCVTWTLYIQKKICDVKKQRKRKGR